MPESVERILRLTVDTALDDSLFSPLYELFTFDASRFEETTHYIVTEGGRDRHLKGLEIWDHDSLPYIEAATDHAKTLALAQSIEHFSYLNAAPHLLRHRGAPYFFKRHPEGVIWFVNISDDIMRGMWDAESKLARRLRPRERDWPYGNFDIQPYAGIGPDVFPHIALRWLATVFFPHVLFAMAFTIRGAFLFLTQPPIRLKSWGEADPVLQVVLAPVAGLFSDDRGPHRDQRWPVPTQFLPISEIESLLEWWIEKVAFAWNELSRLQDTEIFTVGLTLSRAFAESMIINSSFNHLVRKMLMFQAVDKLASLFHTIGPSTGGSEVDVWKTLVSRSFLSKRLLPFATRVPGCAEALRRMAVSIRESLGRSGLSPRVLRAYRNTAHGYRIKDERTILRHGEPIDNDLPDLLSLLLMYILGSRHGLNILRLPV